MRCLKCHSSRLIRFVDGFGQRRVFCENCHMSILEQSLVNFKFQKRVLDFLNYPKLGVMK